MQKSWRKKQGEREQLKPRISEREKSLNQESGSRESMHGHMIVRHPCLVVVAGQK